MAMPLAPILPPPVLPSRYTQKTFLPYRFVPGLYPHPTENPQGHSFQRSGEEPPAIFQVEEWRKNEMYLFGVDLYNSAYWWESHEAWEGLWKNIPRSQPSSDLLQGLIKISAAFLKWHLHEQRGVEVLYTEGITHLQRVLEQHEISMGISLTDHIAQLSDHFRRVVADSQAWPNPTENYPFLVLKGI